MPVSRSSREGRAQAAGSRTSAPGTTGSLYRAVLGAGGMSSPRGASLASVDRRIYGFLLHVCSNSLPCRGLLYLCFPGKVSTHKWLNNTTVQAFLLLL